MVHNENDRSKDFPHNDSGYLQCCGRVHVKTAARIAGIFLLLLVAEELFGVEVAPHENSLTVELAYILLVVSIVTIVLMYLGIAKNNKYMLIPLLAFTAIVEGLLVMMPFREAFAIYNHSKNWNFILLFTAIYTLIAVVHSWCFYVIYSCYVYLGDFENFLNRLELCPIPPPFPPNYSE